MDSTASTPVIARLSQSDPLSGWTDFSRQLLKHASNASSPNRPTPAQYATANPTDPVYVPPDLTQ